MDDLDGVPRKGQETDGVRGLWKVIKKIRDDISVLQRSAAQRSMSLTDGGDLNISGSGKVRVTGSGDNFGTPYDVSMSIENFVTSSAVWGDVLSPGLNFRSLLTATEGYTRLYSRNGYGIRAETYDPAYGVGQLDVSPSESFMSWQSPDEYRIISVTGDSMRIVHFDHTTNIQTGMTQYGTEMLVGHSDPYNSDPATEKRALLRSGLDGKLSLESYGSGQAGVFMPGDGTLDLRGALTSNGQPIGGAPEWTAVKNKPTSFPPSAHSHAVATTTAAGFMSAADKTKLDGAASAARFRKVAATGLPANLAPAAGWVSFGASTTVPANIFGVGVPYLIRCYAQMQSSPVTGRLTSIRMSFNGVVPDGAKMNSLYGPNNGTPSLEFTYEVTGQAAVTVNPQAQAVGGEVGIATTGPDAPFYTITVTPYTAL